MVLIESVRAVWRCSRNFSTSCVSRDWNVQGRFLDRLMTNKIDSKIQSSSNAKRAIKLLDKRRVAVLNKLYMANISEALSLGDFPEILEKGVQINRVLVKNSSLVEVYWSANEFEDQVEIQNYLSNIAGKVRSNIMYANISGNVPNIVFKRDLSSIHAAETKKLLHQVELEISSRDNILPRFTADEPKSLKEVESDVPEMRMDTFGLPYNRIFKSILTAKKKAYPMEAPTPPSCDEFQDNVFQAQSDAGLIQAQYQRKKEVSKFITLYQKSALNSSARKRNLQNRDEVFFHEEPEEDEPDDFEEPGK